MDAMAKGKFLKGSPQKARLVIDLIRSKNVQDALGILRFTKKRATRSIEKVLLSAVANAKEKNAAADVDQLDRKSTRLNSSHSRASRMPSSA